MSSKSSIYFGHGLHVFEEIWSQDICVESDPWCFDDGPKEVQLNEKYGAIKMPKEAWIKLAQCLIARLADGGEK